MVERTKTLRNIRLSKIAEDKSITEEALKLIGWAAKFCHSKNATRCTNFLKMGCESNILGNLQSMRIETSLLECIAVLRRNNIIGNSN